MNRKAAAERPPDSGAIPKRKRRRNEGAPEKDLIIDAGPHAISGASHGMKRLHGRFKGVDVPIGDLLTDAAGRLIVLGGFGKSQSVPHGAPLRSFVNNDRWCDDTSDGPVRAKVTLNDGAQAVEADSAWVLVAPPDFAPSLENAVTLYDVVYDQTAKVADPSMAVTETIPSLVYEGHLSVVAPRLDVALGERHRRFAARSRSRRYQRFRLQGEVAFQQR